MPAGYEKIKAKFLAKGKSVKYAKKHAAMIWNSKHKGTGQTVGKGRK